MINLELQHRETFSERREVEGYAAFNKNQDPTLNHRGTCIYCVSDVSNEEVIFNAGYILS